MATYFSINDGNFDTASVFAPTLATGDVTGGVLGNVITTTFNYSTPLASSNGVTYCGVALQLSALIGEPTGTIDLILSGADGNSTGTVSYPLSGMTSYTTTNNIVPTTPLGWQYFAFPTPVTIGTSGAAKNMRVGVKTSASNKVSLMGSTLTNLNRHYVTTNAASTPTSTDVTHIVGSLTTAGLVTRTVNYNINGQTLGNLYIHNGGVLNFDHSMTLTLTLIGTQGMQITPNGTVNIGTSVNPVDAAQVHTINLNNCFINVHNGATFNTYGAYKTSYALLAADTAVANGLYSLTTNISDWISNAEVAGGADSIVITPNTSSFSTFEAFTYIFDKADNYSITIGIPSPLYIHNASTYIPSIVNMTRNVRFVGTNTTFGYIRFLDGSNSSLNNTSFKGFRNATYKGLQFCTNSTGSVSLSNCAFNGDAIASMPAFSFDAAKSPTSNVSIKGCSFFGYGATTDIITLNAVSANNFTFTDNIVLSASQNGMLINALSSTYANIKNNFLIGNRQNGLQAINPYVLSGAIGGIGCMNQFCGSVVAGTNNRANYDGLAGYYNTTEGVNIFGNIPQLSSTTFRNLTANNNKTSGVMLSGNSNNLLSPIKVNIDGLVANKNNRAGLEGYAITGNLSTMSLDDNQYGNMLISIGNADTIFDSITSKNTTPEQIVSFNAGGVSVSPNSPFTDSTGDNSFFADSTQADDYLSAFNPNFTFPSDFTIECWISTSVSTLETAIARRIFGFGNNAANGLQLILGTANATAASTLAIFTNAALIVGTTSVDDGNWHHVAISRVSGILRLFVDGKLEGEIANTTNFDAGKTSGLNIFKYAGATSGRFNGFISNFRISSYIGSYSRDFDIPTAPFNVRGSALLVTKDDYASSLPYTYRSLNQSSNIEILSGRNYSATLFKNSNLKGNNVNAIDFNSTKFEQFSMDSSTLSSNVEDIGSSSNIDFLQGSYQFNNCTFGTGILSSTIENYQPEVFTENGFVVMKENGVANKHYRLLKAGKISLDTTLAKSPNTISEKLQPTSTDTKLRCGSKMIPVNKNQSYTIGCYVYKSSGYSGAAPRLMLKHNSALGYVDTVLATSVGSDETWELLTGSVPAALDQGIFEVYVDCSGESGSGSVNIDNWTLV